MWETPSNTSEQNRDTSVDRPSHVGRWTVAKRFDRYPFEVVHPEELFVHRVVTESDRFPGHERRDLSVSRVEKWHHWSVRWIDIEFDWTVHWAMDRSTANEPLWHRHPLEQPWPKAVHLRCRHPMPRRSIDGDLDSSVNDNIPTDTCRSCNAWTMNRDSDVLRDDRLSFEDEFDREHEGSRHSVVKREYPMNSDETATKNASRSKWRRCLSLWIFSQLTYLITKRRKRQYLSFLCILEFSFAFLCSANRRSVLDGDVKMKCQDQSNQKRLCTDDNQRVSSEREREDMND